MQRALSHAQRAFFEAQRVARLATADAAGQPHVVPICYALAQTAIYFTVDEKPKRRPGAMLKRLSNITRNPKVAVIVDRYDDDWDRLGWVMVRGRAEVIESGDEHLQAQALLRERYPQLAGMRIDTLPVVAIRIEHVAAWGNLMLA